MPTLVDTWVLIGFLRCEDPAFEVLERVRRQGSLHASGITRLELLAGMRPGEEHATGLLISTLIWHDVDTEIAVRTGELGR